MSFTTHCHHSSLPSLLLSYDYFRFQECGYCRKRRKFYDIEGKDQTEGEAGSKNMKQEMP